MKQELAPHVLSHAMSCLPATIERLKKYLQVPAISCDPAHEPDVCKLARRISDDLVEMGLDAEVKRLPNALPIVSASKQCSTPGRPTVLIYGHFDLQPVAGEAWSTPPHEAVIAGERLYARGSADDMGGWVSHLAALEAWLAIAQDIPVNIKLLLEGEEEIGSPNLERYMDAFPDDFSADVMVLTDCENPSEDIPGLTVSLRGLYEVELSCSAMHADVHSGLWGNMVPDPGNSLILLLSRLLDDDGRLKLGRMPVPKEWRVASAETPLTDPIIAEAAHLLPGVAPLPRNDRSAAEWLWRQPAVTVLSTSFPTPDRHKNAIRAQASAILSIRLAPGQTREQMHQLLERVLLDAPPGGVQVELKGRDGSGQSWLYEPKGPAFEAADRAYTKAWGRPLLQIGIGGSIPFVALFARRFGDLPLILNGVLDPMSSAHGPNESIHLGIFEKAIQANILLLEELGNEPSLCRAGETSKS